MRMEVLGGVVGVGGVGAWLSRRREGEGERERERERGGEGEGEAETACSGCCETGETGKWPFSFGVAHPRLCVMACIPHVIATPPPRGELLTHTPSDSQTGPL